MRKNRNRPESDEPLSEGRVEYLEAARQRVRNRRIRRTAVLLVLLNLQWFRLLRGGLDQTALDFMQCIARAILVPGFVFLGGTLLRKKLNFPRPYEQPGFTPLVEKETHGQSFPSRHALSAAVLAAVWLSFYPAVGGVMVAVTVAICVLRVLAGVHFPRDVIAGALLGFSLGIVGMRLL